jgi:hypothetical protein
MSVTPLVANMIVSVRVKRLRNKAARGSCVSGRGNCENLLEMYVSM